MWNEYQKGLAINKYIKCSENILRHKLVSLLTAKITSFSECIFRVYLIQECNQKISLYLVWKSIICSTKSLLNYPFIYFLKGEIHVLNLNRISVIGIDSLLIFCISKLICRDQNKIYNFHLLTSSRLSVVRDKTTMNVSSLVILDCRKSNNSCWLSRLLIGSWTWSKGKSCWSHLYFANQIWNEKYQQGIRTYDWSSDSHHFVFISASIHDLRLRLT